VAHRGSGDHRVEVVYATPGTKLHKQHAAAHENNKRLILPKGHALAKKAFEKQTSKTAKSKAKSAAK
jgi:hypothetical protein